MAMNLKLTGLNGFVAPAEMENMSALVNTVNEVLLSGKGAGNDFLGWLDLPVNYDKEEFARIQQAANILGRCPYGIHRFFCLQANVGEGDFGRK